MGIVAKVLVSFGHLHRPIRNYIKASQSFFSNNLQNYGFTQENDNFK